MKQARLQDCRGSDGYIAAVGVGAATAARRLAGSVAAAIGTFKVPSAAVLWRRSRVAAAPTSSDGRSCRLGQHAASRRARRVALPRRQSAEPPKPASASAGALPLPAEPAVPEPAAASHPAAEPAEPPKPPPASAVAPPQPAAAETSRKSAFPPCANGCAAKVGEISPATYEAVCEYLVDHGAVPLSTVGYSTDEAHGWQTCKILGNMLMELTGKVDDTLGMVADGTVDSKGHAEHNAYASLQKKMRRLQRSSKPLASASRNQCWSVSPLCSFRTATASRH